MNLVAIFELFFTHSLCSDRVSCPSTRRERIEEKENDKEDQELDVKRNKDDKTAEAETSALHLLKKPLVEPKQEEGIVNKPCSHLL